MNNTLLSELTPLNKEKQNDSGSKNYLIVSINDKIMPIDRGILYEDTLNNFLSSKNYGEICGGGTFQLESGEIHYCDLEILLKDVVNKKIIDEIINKLEEIGAPKGSELKIELTGEIIKFGKKEGLAIYLDGENLSDKTYAECDSSYVLNELVKLTGDDSNIARYWQSNTETALYLYSNSYTEMKKAISKFVNQYPLCKNARIIQIA